MPTVEHRTIPDAPALAGRRRAMLAVAALAAALPLAAGAQTAWPAKSIRIIVPQPPGGGFDNTARLLADKLGPLLGQPVIVENKPGSGTLVGTDYAAKAAPDGYTLLLGALSNIALNPGMYAKLSYDPLHDFTPIGLAVAYSYTLVARSDLPQKSLRELIQYSKANPGKISYASGGNGSGQHVAAAATAHLAGVNWLHIPYKGAQAAYQDVLAGRVDLFFDITPTARTQIEGGRAKPLAVSSRERQPSLPDVPSVAETGVANLDMESWFGLFAPAGVPAPVVQRLQAEFAKVMAMPDVIERWKASGGRPLQLTPAETTALIRRDTERWTALLREMKLKAD
ncbi:Tripartite-type tricarboxylate transporter, receptor component TctC [Noviherbaspirillum humi]|uniref:Tripartite-type tricarboxylate transporter, receptor component TctC n=1 Tax=Noviherbaspirillum humi TaxID=1688639 RepID=A0A239IS32_9BURK|nr:tripartite tricarboxylate transporter substrate binding protein [Noviherbaspirillum humi]SNS96450.1 Tripartite-type tricarboxylate transporter, receptor component TctC [Noviherbaspirillum humi]